MQDQLSAWCSGTISARQSIDFSSRRLATGSQAPLGLEGHVTFRVGSATIITRRFVAQAARSRRRRFKAFVRSARFFPAGVKQDHDGHDEHQAGDGKERLEPRMPHFPCPPALDATPCFKALLAACRGRNLPVAKKNPGRMRSVLLDFSRISARPRQAWNCSGSARPCAAAPELRPFQAADYLLFPLQARTALAMTRARL